MFLGQAENVSVLGWMSSPKKDFLAFSMSRYLLSVDYWCDSQLLYIQNLRTVNVSVTKDESAKQIELVQRARDR